MEEYQKMRQVILLIILSTFFMLLSNACIESKFKTRSQMTTEEIASIENLYHPGSVEVTIPPFLEDFDGPALRVNGREIMASDIRNLYHQFVVFRDKTPEQAKEYATVEYVRATALATQYPDTIDASISRLEAIRDNVNRGEVDFASMVVENSQEPESESSGGSLATINIGRMVPIFEAHAFTAPIDTVSGPFPTIFGWHLILVSARDDRDPENATADASHLLLYHGLNPDRRNDLNDTQAIRWGNSAAIEVLADELSGIIATYFPHAADNLNTIESSGEEANEDMPDGEIEPVPESDTPG